MTRTCRDCDEVKPIEDFPRVGSGKNEGYRRHICKPCKAKLDHTNYTRRPPREGPSRYMSDPDYRDAHRARQLLYRHNITVEQRDAMLEAQGGGCAICGTINPQWRGWCVDHDHACCPSRKRSCGKCVRGVLCGPCNAALGGFQDSVEVLSSAIRYLTVVRQSPV